MTRCKYSGLALSSSLYSGTLLLLPQANARQALPRVICAQVSASAGDQQGRDAGKGGEGEGVGGGESRGLEVEQKKKMFAGQWVPHEFEGLLTCHDGKKRWYQCKLCDYFNHRLHHSKMHYHRMSTKKKSLLSPQLAIGHY